ncbi:flagellar hook-associated protein FlgL [Propionivibrio soli]|uniref:flagellar hook-associated protein FlgL n=1 Tax=Propionivibrio soli TaxID=2976531 RepID=UPI0021E8EB53|nr:flagellar hook-associated protein FlgL [Propionivibrio soli]
MRISTSQIYDSGSSSIMDGQANLYKIQNQLSSGKRFLSAKDDPVAAAQVVLTKQSMAVNAQYSDNQANASSQLALEEDRLQSVVDSIQYVMEETVAGGNASYSDSEREFISQTLQSQFEFLFGVANSKDANGYYLFSGYQGSTQPFQKLSSGGVQYIGDDGQRLLQVSASRQIAVSDSGRDIFQSIRTGNGTFAMSAGTTNTGTGVIGAGSVTNPTAWTGHNYSISFATATQFTVTDTTTSAVLGPYSYTSGAAITAIPGTSLSISGTPAAGDTFSVQPSTEQSLFTTIQNLATAFSTDISGNPTAGAAVRNVINAEMQNLNLALENVSSVQSSIGSRRSELSSLTNVSDALELQYKSTLSDLQDIDYAAAISEYSQQQLQLEAAQSSFAKIMGLSLFNYI